MYKRATRLRRILSSCFKLNGMPKKSFKTLDEANDFLKKSNQTNQQEAYACEFHNFHVGKRKLC